MGLALGLLLPTLALPASASPQNDLAAKTAQAKKLEAQIEADHMRAEVLNEDYLTAQAAVADAQAKMASAEAGIAKAEADAGTLRNRLGNRAATLYMGAGNNDPFQINATDVRELGSRAKYSEAAADQDSRLIDKLRVAEENLGLLHKNFEKVAADAGERQKKANDALGQLKAATAAEEQSLAAVKGEIGQLVNQIEVAKRRADEAAARAAFAAAQAQARQDAAAAAARKNASGNASSASVDITPQFNAPAPSSGAAAAVAYAWAQQGKPYQYAGTGPNSFDCSGLTMMSWAQGGVSMPHSSYAQATMFPRVPDSDLKPGDLSIYYGDHHHVAIYVGNGMTMAATHTGDVVRLQPVFRDSYQFSVRPG